MTSPQGWDLAEFRCGRCLTQISSNSEREFARLVANHKANCPPSTDRPAAVSAPTT